ncbi:MAG: gluconeogenesis factor YvcK family protein [Patescibacteria group bacterium]
MIKKIVTIGGGNGQSILLRELKKYDLDITALVSMVDNGGSTGIIRNEYQVLPSGDVRRCLGALVTYNLELQQTMEYRFKDGFLKDHNFGNLLMLALEKKLNSYELMIEYLSKAMEIKGQVLPVTLHQTQLMAQLENGEVISGETNIDIPDHDADLKIQKVYLEPEVLANPKAIKAISEADLIIYTIGDLYTSVIPNLLVSYVKEAINKSKAKKVYTCNRTTKKGETQGFKVNDFVKTLKQYLGSNSLDYVLVDENLDPSPAGYELVELDKVKDAQVIKADLSTEEDRAHIDGKKLAKAINDLCQTL